jgi:type II secretory pathway component PulJ
MKRPVPRTSGYTLIEILVATTLSLILLGAVIAMLGKVGQSIANSRSSIEMADRLRLAEARLQLDLAGVTATMLPPRRPDNNEGYFVYIEGPVGAAAMTNTNVNPNVVMPLNPAVNSSHTPTDLDTTVGDFDDVLMFTIRSTDLPFVGKYGNTTIQSDTAEVIWFVRGRTLYRRVLLVAPWLNSDTTFTSQLPTGFYARCDVSVHRNAAGTGVVANTLGDLTRREFRFAHPSADNVFPYDAARWNYVCTMPSGCKTTVGNYNNIRLPAIPTLRECSSSQWVAGGTLPPAPTAVPTLAALDFWSNSPQYRLADNAMISAAVLNLKDDSSRVSDDVILTNVIGFDVKAWDPDVSAYVDMGNTGAGRFSGAGSRVNRTDTTNAAFLAGVYDTFSNHYETEGRCTGDTSAGRAVNGLDEAGNSANGNVAAANGKVDDTEEMLTSPPYPYPLRGIQVKIRTFEPDSRQIREVTVTQEFLPQ